MKCKKCLDTCDCHMFIGGSGKPCPYCQGQIGIDGVSVSESLVDVFKCDICGSVQFEDSKECKACAYKRKFYNHHMEEYQAGIL